MTNLPPLLNNRQRERKLRNININVKFTTLLNNRQMENIHNINIYKLSTNLKYTTTHTQKLRNTNINVKLTALLEQQREESYVKKYKLS